MNAERTDTPPAERSGGTAARRARLEQSRTGGSTRAADRTTPGTTTPPGPEGATARAQDARVRRELDPDRLAALEAQREFLLRSLDDLEREHDAGDVDDIDYASLKDDYTARAAAVLRAIESRDELAVSTRRDQSKGRGWVWALAVVVVAVVAGIAVAQASGRRGANDTVTGDIRQDTRDQLLEAGEKISSDPLGAAKIYDSVLEQQPANVEALTYRGWALWQIVLKLPDSTEREKFMDSALESIEKAIAIDATYPDAHVFHAIALSNLDRPAEALADLNAIGPGDVPADMAPLVEQLRTRLQRAVATSGTTVGTAP